MTNIGSSGGHLARWRNHLLNRRRDRRGRGAADRCVAASMHDRGMVLFHASRGRLYMSNATGACVWQGLERGLPLDDIALEISDRHGVPVEIARRDAARFVAALEREQLMNTEERR